MPALLLLMPRAPHGLQLLLPTVRLPAAPTPPPLPLPLRPLLQLAPLALGRAWEQQQGCWRGRQGAGQRAQG